MFRQVYTNINPLVGKTQQYKILIDDIDVTSAVTGDVILTEEKGLLPELQFTLNHGRKWIDKLRYGSLHTIVFSGGTLNPVNTFQDIFRGTLFRSSPSFGTEGVRVTIISFGKSWKGATQPRSFIYPSPDNPRGSWATKSTLSVKTLLEQLIASMGMKAGEIVVPDSLKPFTQEKPIKQNNRTDWNFILYIAQRLESVVWEENGEVHFLPYKHRRDKSVRSKRIAFVYQDPENPVYIGPDQVLVSQLEVQEDSEAQLTFTRPIKDVTTGEDVLYDWKLDENKVAELNRTDSRAAWSLLNRVWNDTISDEELNSYFIRYEAKKAFKDDPFVEGDNHPFLGKTVSFTIPGNVNVLAYQYYPIYNISRFSSEDSSGWWFLQKVTHKWGSNGFETTLDFIR